MCNAIIIAPQSGQSREVRKGQKIIVTDIEGGQVADFFAQAKEDADEFLSTGVNINACMGSNRKIIHPVNLFMHTEIGNDGKIKVLPPLSKPGDKIILRAERDLLLGIAACSVSESDCNSGKCTAIRVDLED